MDYPIILYSRCHIIMIIKSHNGDSRWSPDVSIAAFLARWNKIDLTPPREASDGVRDTLWRFLSPQLGSLIQRAKSKKTETRISKELLGFPIILQNGFFAPFILKLFFLEKVHLVFPIYGRNSYSIGAKQIRDFMAHFWGLQMLGQIISSPGAILIAWYSICLRKLSVPWNPFTQKNGK